MGKAKASAGLRIGEGAFAWASAPSEEARAGLITATGCSALELVGLLRGEISLFPQVAAVMCSDALAVLQAWGTGELDVEETRAALIAELEKLVPAQTESGDNGNV